VFRLEQRVAKQSSSKAHSLGRKEEKQMHMKNMTRFSILALMIAVSLIGCGGDPDQAPVAPGSPLSPPSITVVTPPNASVGVCPNSPIISATFNKAMNPATLNTTTFTLVAAGGASVAGAVSYVVATNVATFTPSANLALSTAYTATVTTSAMDTFGNGLAANFVWTFTTAAVACAGPPLPPPGVSLLATACNFGILAATPAVTSTGATIITGGDVGISPAAAIVGFPPATLTGTEHAGDAVALAAQNDLTTAYNNIGTTNGGTFGLGTGTGTVVPADIGGQTLAPGVYRTTSAQPSLGITGNLTLSGPATGVWIFQIGSTLITATNNSQVIMSGGGLSKNVFWQVGSSATLGTYTIFAGNILAQASITANTGATLNGRALARTGAVTLAGNTVNVPTCP
jgi:hypothetical protein